MKILTAPHMERCIGCLLCVLEAGKTEKQISIESPLIKVMRKGDGFIAEIDSGLTAAEKVAQSCPRNCLAVEEI